MGVLPTLIHRLQAVTVGIENVRSVIPRIVIQASAWLAVIRRASSGCCLVKGINLGLAPGHKADMRGLGIRIALPQPEEYAAVPSETLKVGMAWRAILAIVVDGMLDAERSESPFVKGNRPIDIPDGYKNVIEQQFPFFNFKQFQIFRCAGKFPRATA